MVLRPRIKVESLTSKDDLIDVFFTHHTESGRQKLTHAFKEVAKENLPRIRAKYVGGWLEKIDARLGEIRLAIKAAESERELSDGDVPLLDEKEQLESDREMLVMESSYLGYELSLPGSFGSLPPWWKSPPKCAILIGKCAGFGLMAVFPAVIILELMWPRRRAPEEVPK